MNRRGFIAALLALSASSVARIGNTLGIIHRYPTAKLIATLAARHVRRLK